MGGAFPHFGGIAQEVVFDNARALVDHHDAATREVRFNEHLHGFAPMGLPAEGLRAVGGCWSSPSITRAC